MARCALAILGELFEMPAALGRTDDDDGLSGFDGEVRLPIRDGDVQPAVLGRGTCACLIKNGEVRLPY